MTESDDSKTSQNASPVADAQQPGPQRSVTRRDVAKLAATSVGALALGAVLPGEWLQPIVQVGFLPAHAQATRAARKGSGRTVDIRDLPREVIPPNNGTAGAGGAGGEGAAGEGAAGEGAAGGGGTVTRPGGGTRGSRGQPGTDDGTGAGGPGCPPIGPLPQPTNLQLTSTATGGTFTWDGRGETTFLVDVFDANNDNSTLGNVASFEVAGNFTSLTDLQPATEYTAEVKAARCGQTSPTSSVSFVTQIGDVAPRNLVVDTVYCDGVYLSWNSLRGASRYEIQISDDGGRTWRRPPPSAFTDTLVEGLCPDTDYLVRVRGVGGNGSVSQPTTYTEYSDVKAFRTPSVGGEYCPKAPDYCGGHSSSGTAGHGGSSGSGSSGGISGFGGTDAI